jgi:protein SCO1/2
VNDLADVPDVEFVSVTVDPENDTPERLSAFTRGVGAESPRWHWLTGDREQILELARESFFAPTGERQADGQIPHSTRYYVVDRRGRLRMVHDTQTDPDPRAGPVRGVLRSVRMLLDEKPEDAPSPDPEEVRSGAPDGR